MGKKHRAIMLMTNDKMVFACGTFILNIIEVIPEFDKIVVYCDELSIEQENALRLLDERVELIKYTLDEFADEIGIDSKEFGKTEFYRIYSYLIAAKFKIFTLLHNYRQVVFFDTDMLIKSSIDELLNETGFDIAWISNQMTINGKLKQAGFDVTTLPDDDYFRQYAKAVTPNGGFWIVNDNFNYIEAYKIGLEFSKKAVDIHPYVIDETMIGYIVYKLNLKTLNVNKSLYNIRPSIATNSAILIHFIGLNLKPWTSQAVQTVFPEWLRRYKEFCRITSLPSKLVKEYPRICEVIDGFMTTELWQNIFKDAIIPSEFKIFSDNAKRLLSLHYNNFMHFRFIANVIFVHIFCEIYIDKTVALFDKNFRDTWDKFISQYPNCLDKSDKSFYICKFAGINRSKFPQQFQRIYASTRQLRRLCAPNPDLGTATRGKFKTFFNTYAACDGFRLFQTDSLDNALEILMVDDILAFKLPGEDRYIRRISMIGLVEIAEQPEYFKIHCENGKIAVIAFNHHLSARNDSERSFQLVPQCKAWEYFEFLPKSLLTKIWRQ